MICKFGNIESMEEWQEYIMTTLSDPENQKIFAENLWRLPMVVLPERGVSLQYILPYFFQDEPTTGLASTPVPGDRVYLSYS